MFKDGLTVVFAISMVKIKENGAISYNWMTAIYNWDFPDDFNNNKAICN